jgi:mannose-6-phosphate isomerase-like protein (cupin superfamily)
MIRKTHYRDINAFTTRDGSIIRELMHPAHHGNVSQSLAEATIPVGAGTLLHKHRESEEIYYVTGGSGSMELAEEIFDVAVGDSICIPAGSPHRIINTGAEPLTILCCCSPAYSDGDTVLL